MHRCSRVTELWLWQGSQAVLLVGGTTRWLLLALLDEAKGSCITVVTELCQACRTLWLWRGSLAASQQAPLMVGGATQWFLLVLLAKAKGACIAAVMSQSCARLVARCGCGKASLLIGGATWWFLLVSLAEAEVAYIAAVLEAVRRGLHCWLVAPPSDYNDYCYYF